MYKKQATRYDPGGLGTPLYKPYMYVPTQRVGFLTQIYLVVLFRLLLSQGAQN